jgi:Holliday junction resolvase RusA-like endonuclease
MLFDLPLWPPTINHYYGYRNNRPFLKAEAYDIDNRAKALLDALQAAGVFLDDRQIDYLTITRCDPVKGGAVRVMVIED